jgi:hypothetical protein
LQLAEHARHLGLLALGQLPGPIQVGQHAEVAEQRVGLPGAGCARLTAQALIDLGAELVRPPFQIVEEPHGALLWRQWCGAPERAPTRW